MRRIIEKYSKKLELRKYRRKVKRALELNLRGEVRSDGLKLEKVRSRLQIQWRARDVHPWDRDLPPEKQSPLFVEQSLADTEAAICRLFEELPQIDTIEVSVLEPASENTIIAGTVHRFALDKPRRLLSVRMRLRELGITFRLIGSQFEPLEPEYENPVSIMT